MDDGQEQDNYEERLKEVFNSFDASGCGSLCAEELSDLCQSLHLDDATPALLHALLQNQDHFSPRVDFDQFKNALILVLSSTIETSQTEQEAVTKPESPEVQPKFVKGSKRYGRRSTPESIEPISDLSGVTNLNPDDKEDLGDNYDSAVPRKRERWNAQETSPEEYEAEGQMHLWNPDEPSTPRGSVTPLSARLEERLREACEDMTISWEGYATQTELLSLCDHLGLEMNADVLLSLPADEVVNVQDFVSRIVNHNKPPTPSASTPYRQLKRHHSTQPFDEGGRRIATPSALTSTIGMRLFSSLDDGSGYTPAENVLDTWIEEGIENSTEVLEALNFNLDGKLSLGDLTMALENELLVTKNGIHQAALASFKAEIRYLLERVDREIREKEKIRSDLEKAEKLKTQLAAEVDEHHTAIEHMNNLNIRKLEQDHKEKMAALRSELMKEMDQIQQQAGLQREELEAEMEKIREDESFLRDHLSISVKENRRLEMELLDSTEKLVEAQNQVVKLQMSLDNIMKDKFGDLDPGSADFLLQEERIKQLRSGYEAQCRELQDRIDELQSELQEFHTLGRGHQSCHKPLSEELESKSPGMESDPGLGSEEVQPFSMSLEAEMMLEQLKEQHLQEMDDLRNQLESKINEFDKMVEKQRAAHEDQKAALALRYQQELQALREEMSRAQNYTQELQIQLEQAELEQTCLQQKQDEERDELETLQEEEVGSLRQQLLEAHTCTADLEEQLKTLETQQAEQDEKLQAEMEEQRNQHASEIKKLKEEHEEMVEARLAEEREKLQEEKSEVEKRLLSEWEREKKVLQESYEAKLKEEKLRCEEECDEVVKTLTEKWQKEKAQLDEQNNETLQVLLEEEMLRLIKEQEEKESRLREQWERELTQIQEHHEKALHERIREEKLHLQEEFEKREKKLKEEWDVERLQLEEDYEGMVQDRLNEEREKMESEKEEAERKAEKLMAEERERLEASHREAMKELSVKHAEEREALSAMLDKLREDIALERKEIESSFTQRIKEVEARFSGDQESVTERFQADILKIEQHYQSELKDLSDSHMKQKLHWEEEIQKVLESTEEQRRTMEADMEQEREKLSQEWTKEQQELEGLHRKETETLMTEKTQLQNELDDLISKAQTKEIELSKQLNDLHNRLQESMNTRHELLVQSEDKALQTELLLNQTVEGFKQERAELLRKSAELESKYNEMLSISERQIVERIELLTERDDLKIKIEKLEMLLKQTAADFELEKKELQENLSMLEKKLEDNLKHEEELQVERDVLKERIKDLEMEVALCSASKEKEEKELDELNILVAGEDPPQILIEQDVGVENPYALDETHINTENQDDDVSASNEQDDQIVKTHDLNPSEGCDDGAEASSLEQTELYHAGCDPPENHLENKNEALVSTEILCEPVSLLQALADGENKEAKPQDAAAVDCGSDSHEEEEPREPVVEPSVLQEAGDCDEESLEEAEVYLPNDSHNTLHELGLWEPSKDEDCEDSDCDQQENLQVLYNTATEENILLHEKICLLQQKTEILENLLAHNNEKIKTGHQVLEENYSLKVKMLLLMEHIKELERNTLKMADLQIKHEDCMCENAKLKEQNGELEKRVWYLEGRMNIIHDFHDQQMSLVDEISRLREENVKLSELFSDLEKQDEILTVLHSEAEPAGLDVDVQLEEKLQAVAELEDCCREFEKQNIKLRRAITELQDKSQILNETTQAHRCEASRIAEENINLRQKIAALKEKDLKETQEELTQTLEQLKQEKFAAQKAAVNFKKKISELRLQSQHLGDENGKLSEKNAQNVTDMENLRQQLMDLMEEQERKEVFLTEEKNQLAACVSALEEENVQLSQQLSELRAKGDTMETQLSHLVEERKSVDKETVGLRNQLAKAQERVKTADETLQAVNRQSVRLKSDLHALQQERDSLKQEVTVLHKQLQNANDKNHVLEMALHSSGLQSHSKKLFRDEMTRLKEQELRQENEKLKAEAHSINSDLVQSREKIRQLDAALKQQGQSSVMVKTLEQENASLKQELEAQRELTKSCEAGQRHTGMESLQQENEALKAQMARLSTQLIETFQGHFGALLPPSPHRMPRGPHRGEDPDNMQQDDRERKMKNMEERMMEIELSLRNVKLLLKEKVAQLKDQLHKNGKADVMIKDLYLENSQLLKALEITEQRQKIAEKKNYLLEEKISSLNKIVRDLNPTPLTSLQYHYTCS